MTARKRRTTTSGSSAKKGAAKKSPKKIPKRSKATGRPSTGDMASEVESVPPKPAPRRGTTRRTPVFDPSRLDRTVIALPLVERFKEQVAARYAGTPPEQRRYPVVIDLNLDYHDGRDVARREIIEEIARLLTGDAPGEEAARQTIHDRLTRTSPLQYVAARLTEAEVIALVRHDVDQADNQWSRRRIYRIWPDFEVQACLTKSPMTVKADAARIAFNARGRDIVWAVMDSGIDARHPHFGKYRNLEVRAPVAHMSFLPDDDDDPLTDQFGHGTHVAGIIGGCLPAPDERAAVRGKAAAVYSAHGVREEESDEKKVDVRELRELCSIAPECTLVSMKVLNEEGAGTTTAIMRALQKVNEVNQNGRRLLIHGVNLSLGYDFDPEWFACGQSPLCVEVDRLVRSGVVVVVAAGNSGFGYLNSAFTNVKPAGMALTINDPGNAETAITVGSTHREMPHIYGASYFSSKGPTGDGRVKPDLLAPGEKILSCAAGTKKEEIMGRGRSAGSPSVRQAPDRQVQYIEDSGTSMAAPHVSGAIAAFLSVRREFQGQPERVKSLFLENATDLNRDRYFQGHGLVDLMRTIQSV